mgnify:CR=1 FL=1|jgi:hypothetical protein
MAKYQLLAHDKSVVKDDIELTLEQVQSYGEDNDVDNVFQYDEYEDGTTIFDTISEGTFIIKRIGSFESED